jgi:hypothetical protein
MSRDSLKSMDRELDAQTKALVELDRREIGLDDRLGVVEGKLRKDQVQTAAEHGLPPNLTAVQESVWKRLSPRRNLWPEVLKFDERVAELEMRHAAKADELRELRDREIAAPAEDADHLATWQLDGEHGPRPEPELPALQEQIRQRQEDWEALTRATERVLIEKSTYIAKHRSRLAGEAAKERERATRRCHELVHELAEEREILKAARHTEVWCSLYPSELAAREVPDTFAGARAVALRPLGIEHQVPTQRVIEALHHDVDWVAKAADPEQKAAMGEGRDPRKPPATVWDKSDEGQQWHRDERQRALHRLRNPT